MQFKGKLTYVSPVELVGLKGFKKITVVVEQDTTDGGESMAGTLFGAKTDNLVGKVGDTVEIDVAFKSTQGNNGKYYQNININGMRVLNSKAVVDENELPR